MATAPRVLPRFCHMLKISQPIITLMSPYLREETKRRSVAAAAAERSRRSSKPGNKKKKTHFSSVFFLLEGEKDSSWRQGWLMKMTDR